MTAASPAARPPSDWPAVLAFLISAIAGVGLAVVYASGGDPQAEGALLLVSSGGLGVGLVVVAHRLLSGPPRVEEREDLVGDEAEVEAVEAEFETRAALITRRRVLGGALAASVGAIGVAALFPIRSLGPNPGSTLLHTPWRRGRRAIGDDGRFIRADGVPENGLVTVFPAGYPGSANGQAVLIRVPPRVLRRAASGSAADAPQGLLVFSKVCTHAGCPVGLYQAQTHQLLCPCHQSAFDVLQDAAPVLGPAARALPRLPIGIDAEGFVVATGDFTAPVGPAWWSRP